MYLNCCYTMVCFLLFCFLGIGQELNFKNYTTEEGLPSNEVYSIFQDKNGCMWFATDRGICQYNGIDFKRFEPKDGLTDITVFDFYPQENGQVWCSTFNGKLFYFQNGTNHFIPYKFNKVIADYLKANKITTFILKGLAIDKYGSLYVSGGDIFFKINPKGVITVLIKKAFNGIATKTQSRMPRYIHTFTINKKQKINCLSFIKSDFPLSNKGILRGTASFSRHKLAITDSLISFYEKGKPLKDITYKNHLPIGLGEYDNDHFWIGFRGKGLKVFNFKGQITDEFLKSHSVTNVFKDCYGGLWVSTLDAGIFYKQPNQIETHSFESATVNSLTKDGNKTLYIGSLNGNVYEKKFKRKVKEIYKGVTNFPAFVQYFPYKNNVFCYSDNHIFSPSKDFKDKKIIGILKMSDDNDTTLILSQYGIFTRYNKEKIRSDTVYFRIHDISIVNDKLYLGTIGGLKILEKGKVTKKKQKLFNYRIEDIDYVPSKGIVYMASLGKGVLVYNLKTNQVFAIDKSKGLSNNLVTEIFVENKNTIWACTNYGINRICFSNDSEYKIDYITTANGLISNQVKDIEIIEDSIYVGTTKGLCAISKAQFKSLLSEKKYFLRLKNILVNNKDNYENTKGLNLSHSDNQLDFFVEAVSFSNKKKLSYRYKLEGLDVNWHYTEEKKIAYAYIPPGSYKMIIQVVEDGRMFSKEKIVLPIFICKPFWKTGWFIGILIFTFGGILYLFFKIRVLTYNEDIVRELLRLLMKRIKKKDSYFSFRESGKEIRIKTTDILFLKSSGNYIDIETLSRTYTIRGKIGDFIDQVKDPLEFLRVHRSYIIRIDKVEQKSKKAVFINNQEIPVGETYLTELDKIVF